MNIGPFYRELRDRFRAAGLPTPELDARILIAHVTELRPSDIVLAEDRALTVEQASDLRVKANQRVGGKPVGRILGEREFYGLVFKLNDATLEPRPDTETLIDAVLARAQTGKPFRLADIGTGTGAIAVALLSECPHATALAVDLSPDALSCAYDNAALNEVEDRLLVAQSDFCEAVGQGYDWLISNPPYIRSDVIRELSDEVRLHDPALALDGGQDGLEAYRRIVAQSHRILKDGGWIAFEIGYDQAGSVSALLLENDYCDVEVLQDLAGQDRVVAGRKGKSAGF
ncbi:peptide chain release factor N(5)-glutamine methyltransferase [Roseibium sp. RKSG952]|uniref:peptide chain release factor N(5)-glutamine methyltransferase n=1 Tax=Roseibium sp. RKSG952 TaxID=2529384 RepID=UPI0012BD4F8B|nr:peptide chain release factor N(5)-glutamine methyltransferase [Roseibium sp. RKSG952]MTH99248.1 peptide chain release factor N(5)-glutamine methyltransferase [Roseibium sp. RKSG952]